MAYKAKIAKNFKKADAKQDAKLLKKVEKKDAKKKKY